MLKLIIFLFANLNSFLNLIFKVCQTLRCKSLKNNIWVHLLTFYELWNDCFYSL
uniref:Uncharacterized protein n=1 Tax=virus sp. ctML55 TaxID=2827627 RepID=A0A8S5RIF6_9VIRU|nr:MAG TPA: hypothetical protein [virus sp. ctML55]